MIEVNDLALDLAGAHARTPHETTTSPRENKQHSELGKQLVTPLQSPGVLRRLGL